MSDIIINQHNLTREKNYIPKPKKIPACKNRQGPGHEDVRIQLTTDPYI